MLALLFMENVVEVLGSVHYYLGEDGSMLSDVDELCV